MIVLVIELVIVLVIEPVLIGFGYFAIVVQRVGRKITLSIVIADIPGLGI